MPALAADYFGCAEIGSIYGLMLTAWGAAGVVGPTALASIRQATGGYQSALKLMALVTLVSSIVPLLRPPAARWSEPARRTESEERVR